MPKPYIIGVNRDEGALFADLINQAAGGLSTIEYQTLLNIVFGTGDAATIRGFTAAATGPTTRPTRAPCRPGSPIPPRPRPQAP